MTGPRKVWKLGDYLPAGNTTQEIDHVWEGIVGQRQRSGYIIGDSNHAAKIRIYGADCVELASRIVEFLNADNAPAVSPEDDADRALILRVIDSPLPMGSMERASFYHILHIDNGSVGFTDALNSATRKQLDALVAKCQPYVKRGC